MFIHNVCVHAVYNAHLWVCLYTHKVMMYNFMYGWVYVQCTLCTVSIVSICVWLWYSVCTVYTVCTYLCTTVVQIMYTVFTYLCTTVLLSLYIFVYDCGTVCVQCTLHIHICVWLWYFLCTMYTVCTFLCKTVLLFVYNVHCM